MSKKICRIYVSKDSVQPKLLPVLAKEVRELIQNCIFDQLRTSNNQITEDLKDVQKRSELLSRFPDLEYWENPTDAELRELVSQERCDYDGQGGWSYSILDEPTCVTGTLEIFVIGHQAKMTSSFWGQSFKHPGFKFSEELINN